MNGCRAVPLAGTGDVTLLLIIWPHSRRVEAKARPPAPIPGDPLGIRRRAHAKPCRPLVNPPRFTATALQDRITDLGRKSDSRIIIDPMSPSRSLSYPHVLP